MRYPQKSAYCSIVEVILDNLYVYVKASNPESMGSVVIRTWAARRAALSSFTTIVSSPWLPHRYEKRLVPGCSGSDSPKVDAFITLLLPRDEDNDES